MTPLWTPKQEAIKESHSYKFIAWVNTRHHVSLQSFYDLYSWSISNPTLFWESCWDFFEVIGKKGSDIFAGGSSMHSSKFFPDGKLNFAANILRHAACRHDEIALSSWKEGYQSPSITYGELYRNVRHLRQLLLDIGVTKGDVVAGILPNMPLAIEAMLATTSIGAVWTSCSPDFGIDGILDRFGQTQPKVLFACESYILKGSEISVTLKVTEACKQIPSVKKILWPQECVCTDPIPTKDTISKEIAEWNSFGFNDPLVVLYSSGTTGKPKCIIHRTGGVLLEHVKEHGLHVNLQSTDTFFYQTTCSWMMWNWLVSGLFFGAKLILYDGSPLEHKGQLLFEIIDKEKISIFGTNAKWISTVEKLGLHPKETHSLDSLHTMLSTGSPLSIESFHYVYSKIKSDVCLSSISGGTDILGCFALGSPMLPVNAGELQTRSLGMKVEVWDSNKQPVLNQPGELVCTAPFPSQPLGFWNDPTNERITAAYFSESKDVWYHGDFVTLTDRGTMIFHGRSDAVLNPGGVRIGTAELYRQVEKLSWISESLAVGWQNGANVEIVLFVVLVGDSTLIDENRSEIKNLIRQQTTSFHVPKHIIQVSAVPKTRTGKLAELAVADIINGRPVRNIEALQNPESLEEIRSYFTDFATSQS